MNIKVFTAFSGYDSQCLALDRLAKEFPDEFAYDLVGWSDIDKDAITAHNILFPQWADRNYGDISRIDWKSVPDFDLFTYSYPCQDISAAGLQRGFSEGSGTRSGLLWECQKAIVAKRPKFLLMENVKALVSYKFMPDFQKWIDWLDSQGYKNFWKVLNAKDYGVAQNRERVFMVSILDPDAQFEFPAPIRLEKCVADYLEDEDTIDESYYVDQAKTDEMLSKCKQVSKL